MQEIHCESRERESPERKNGFLEKEDCQNARFMEVRSSLTIDSYVVSTNLGDNS